MHTQMLESRVAICMYFALAAEVGVTWAQSEEESGSAGSTSLDSAPHIEESQSFFNGSANYQYPLALPPGTGGIAPSVALSYASQAKWSQTGYGWSLLGIDAIARSTKCGVPTFDERDVFVWSGQDLIRDADGTYHTQKESFARIERLGEGAGSSWLVTTPNGVQYRYGATGSSRILAHENADVVHRWALDRVMDPNGNYYTIQYLRDDASAAYYPQTFTYTMNDAAPLAAHHTVHFAWEGRPDARTSYAEGTRVTTALRLASVESRVDGALHSRHELSYTLGTGGKSLLSAIRVVGSDNATTLTPTKFRYSEGKQRFGAVQSYGDGFGMYISTGYHGASKMLVDINGDGLVDEVARSALNNRGAPRPFEIRLGTIEGRFAEPIEWDSVTDSPGVTRTISHKQQLYSPKLLMDMDGDGRPDIIERAPVRREPGNYQVYLNTGAGFAPAADWGPGEARYVMDTDGRANTTKLLMDINGDGLPDELYRPYQPRVPYRHGRRRGQEEVIYNLQVRLNTGSGFGEPQDWGTMQGLYLKEQRDDAYTVHELVDINGDGLPDDLYRPYARAPRGQPEQLSNLLVRLNTGSGFGPVEDWGTMQGKGIRDTDGGGRASFHDLIDINGDGLLDDVYRSRQTRGQGYKPRDHYLVRLNTGSGFGPVQSWGDGLGSTLHDSYRGTVSHTLMDINGDGLVDDVQRVPGHRMISSARRNVKYAKDYDVRLNQAGPPALLTMVQLPTGGRIEYEYGVSTQFDNTDYTGMPRLANKIRVVTAITRDDAMGGVSTSRISYRGGLYEGFPKCEFRGFREVTVTDATGAKTMSTYLQDDACWGHSAGSQRLSADNARLSTTESEWTYRDIAPGIVFPYIETARTKSFDGADTPRTRELHYVYDDYGNVTQLTDSGDLAVDGDEVRTRTTYAIDADLYIASKPSRVVIEDKHAGAWRRARETVTYYDHSAHGSVRRGNATRVDAWLGEDGYATTTFGHDAYGNVVWTRDANANGVADWAVNSAGHTTDTTYDAAFHTVPVEQRNARDHVTRTEYDALLRPTVSIDANGQRTVTAYDAHGRPVSLTRPGDTAPTMTTEYAQDGVAPEYTILRSHTADGQWLTRYTLVDGFGRTIQTKVPDGNSFIATDRFYDVLGRQAVVSQSYRTPSLVSADPDDQVSEELPLVLIGDSFSNVETDGDGTLAMSGWTRIGEGEAYYGETGEWTAPSGVNGGMVEFSGADRTNRELILGDTDITLGVETEIDLSQWNGRQLMLSAHYGAEYTVHSRKTSCRWIGGRKRCHTRSEHNRVDTPVMLTVTDADSGAVLLSSELPHTWQDRVERNVAAHQVDVAAAAAGARRIGIRLWVLLPCAGQDVSSYAFRVRNIHLVGHKDELRGTLVRDPGQPAVRTEYDALGRVIAQVAPDGTSIAMSYDRGSRAVTDANGVRRTQHLDGYGRLAAIDEDIDGEIHTTRYHHRPATGELEQVIDAAGNFYVFGYDGLGRKITEHDADRGLWQWTHDPMGNIVSQQDANHNVTVYSYDPLHRPVKRVSHSGTETVYAYDTAEFGVGRPAAAKTEDFQRAFSYDRRGRVVEQTLSMDGRSWHTAMVYDDADRVTEVVYPDGERVATRYDARGFVAGVTGDDSYVTGTAYTDQGLVTELAYGNGTSLTYSYYDDSTVDPLSGSALSYRLRTVAASGGNLDLSLEFQHDKLGNVLALLDREDDSRSQHFVYDSASRLVSATGLYGERSYQYDAVGNLMQFAGRRYGYGPGNRVATDGVWNYEHDANGNVIARRQDDVVQTFGFDDLNRMISLFGDGTDERYRYDDGETRLAKTSDGKTTYYIGADYEEVWQDDARLEVIKHYRSGGQKVATRDEDGLKYVYPDHLGSSSRMADRDGNQVKAIWYLPFGSDAKESGEAKARYRYTGKEKDDSGLYYYGARYYDDALGRFMAADSILPDVYDPQQLNRFAYVRNNPIRLIDPDGHSAQGAGFVLSELLSFAFGVSSGTVSGVGLSGIRYEEYAVGHGGKPRVADQGVSGWVFRRELEKLQAALKQALTPDTQQSFGIPGTVANAPHTTERDAYFVSELAKIWNELFAAGALRPTKDLTTGEVQYKLHQNVSDDPVGKDNLIVLELIMNAASILTVDEPGQDGLMPSKAIGIEEPREVRLSNDSFRHFINGRLEDAWQTSKRARSLQEKREIEEADGED